ncbi:MAG: Thioredoxin-disulfide reductase, partial [candidate division WWE3 bacterium GW2011_GWB1_41_6]
VIIGAGVAGLSAGMYSARLGLKTLVLGSSYGSDMPVGGTITTTNIVENYPGFIKITGAELAERIKKHACRASIKIGYICTPTRKNNSFT